MENIQGFTQANSAQIQKLFPSWVYSEEKNAYYPPVERPTDGKEYTWDEKTVSWKEAIPEAVIESIEEPASEETQPREVRPWDFLNPNTEYASKEIAEERYSICVDCPRFTSLTKMCKECGCFMVAKTKLKNAHCPIGKWR